MFTMQYFKIANKKNNNNKIKKIKKFTENDK